MLRIKYFIVVFLVGLLFAHCNRPSNTSNKKIFRYNETAGVNTLDPANARYLEDMRVINQIYDGLLYLDDSMKIQPCIADSYSISEDGLTYTFHLKNEVFFSPHESFLNESSRLISAEDFVYSFNRILDPKVASPGMWIFNQVQKENGFVALNSRTLQINLTQPFPAFLGILTMQYCNVVPEEVVDFYGNEFRSNPIGSGPFKLGFWLEGVSLVLHKSDSYWRTNEKGEKLPHLDAVRVDFIRDKSTMFLDFLKGKYDFISGLDPSYKDELLTFNGELNEAYRSSVSFQKAPFIKTDYIGLLVDKDILPADSPLRVKKFRQALNFSVNRKKLAKYLRNNSVFPASNGFLPKGFEAHGFHLHKGYSYNLEKAKNLLDESNVDLSIPLIISTTSEYVDICEYLQYQWEQLGLKVKVEALQSSNHRDLVANSKIEVFRKSWLADYSDEENFLGLFYSNNFSPGGPNYTHFSNSQFDSLFEKALRTPEYFERKVLYGQMDSLLLDEAPVVPLFYDQVSHFLSKNISNFGTNPVNMLDFSEVEKLN